MYKVLKMYHGPNCHIIYHYNFNEDTKNNYLHVMADNNKCQF